MTNMQKLVIIIMILSSPVLIGLGIQFVRVAIFHVEPFLSSGEERWSSFVDYGGLLGLISITLGVVLFGIGIGLYLGSKMPKQEEEK